MYIRNDTQVNMCTVAEDVMVGEEDAAEDGGDRMSEMNLTNTCLLYIRCDNYTYPIWKFLPC